MNPDGPASGGAEPAAPVAGRKAQAERTRARLLAVAVEQFSGRDYEEVSVASIAGAAGVANGLLFHYFGSKRALYLEAIGAAAAELVRPLPPADGASIRDQLRGWLREHLEHLAEHRGLALRLILGGRGADAEAWQVFEDGRWQVIAAFCERLGLDPSGDATAILLRAGVGAVDEATVGWLAREEPFDAEAFADVLVDLLAASLMAAARLDPTIDVEAIAARFS